MTSTFVRVMDRIGHDIKIAWLDVVKYLPAAEKLAELIFPVPATVGIVNAVDLIRQSVATVEQKFAAAGIASGTGEQKLAQVLSIVAPAVTQLLQAEKINVNQDHITSIINAVVAILNVPQLVPAA